MRNGRGYFNFRPHAWRRRGANSSGGSAAARSKPGQFHDAVHKAEAAINHARESTSEARKQACCSCESNRGRGFGIQRSNQGVHRASPQARE